MGNKTCRVFPDKSLDEFPFAAWNRYKQRWYAARDDYVRLLDDHGNVVRVWPVLRRPISRKEKLKAEREFTAPGLSLHRKSSHHYS